MVALLKRAELDAKFVITFIPDNAFELNQSLNRLGSIFVELAVTFYRDEGRRIKMRLEKKNYGFIKFNVRYCFKVAIYAEFRRDWVEALRMYEDGYHALREVIFLTVTIGWKSKAIMIYSCCFKSWLWSFINKIIGNLKLSISSIHIRYEDLESNPGHPFAAGVTLEKLSASTVDDSGEGCFCYWWCIRVLQKAGLV